jgi:hypothetical protein
VQSAEHTFYGQKDPGFTTTRVANGVVATRESGEAADKTAIESDEPTTVTRVAASTKSAYDDGEKNKSGSMPIGAIVGGAIGGVVLIGLIMLGIFFTLRRKRNKTATAQGPITPPVMNFSPQGVGPSMLDSKMVASPHTQPGSAVSPLQSDGRQSMFGPPSGGSWGGVQSSFSSPPVYEAPGHEAQVHEMGDSNERK